VQVVKFNRGFNSNFDPTQLISLIYEPEFSWSLPNPSSLIESVDQFKGLLAHLGLEKDGLTPNAALKLVRAHSNKSEKEIYMYSSVPSHIRSIKNYSTIMSFLATNAFKNFEIHGMTANLRSGIVAAPAHETDIDTEAYTICTILDTLCTLGKSINLSRITFQQIESLKFNGGDINDLVGCIKSRKFSDSNYNYYKHYLEYIDCLFVSGMPNAPAIILEDSAFYTFLKEQKYNGAWYGKGIIYISYKKDWVVLEILNSKIVSGSGNLSGKVDKFFAAFLCDCLRDNNIDTSFTDSIEKRHGAPGQTYLGFDLSGDLAVETVLNTRQGFDFRYKIIKPIGVNRLKHGSLEYIKENLFILRSDEEQSLKIKTLRIERGEVIPLLKMIVDTKSIESYLITNSYDDFSDFIGQVIMPSYGSEYYITLPDLKEGYMGSELHRVFSYIQTNEPNLLPSKFKTSQIPAAEGSLLRMILKYQECTGKEVIRVPKSLNPSIMSIRNEYPESFSVILNEKMMECFGSIYNESEQIMLYNEFTQAAAHEDPEKVKQKLIRLMCFWGYSALVNTINIFTFSRNIKNHSIFNINNLKSLDSGIYNEYFINLIQATRVAMFKNLNIGHHENKLVKNLFEDDDLDKLFTLFTAEVVYNTYSGGRIYQSASAGHLKFNNLLISMMADPAFVLDLTEELKDNYPLNTLDFNPKGIDEIIATYNTLRFLYIQSRVPEVRHKLNYTKAYEHLPHSLISPLSLFKELKFSRYKPGRFRYHYFLDDYLFEKLNKKEITVHASGVRYLVKQSFSDFSKTKISVHDSYKYKNVLTEDFLDSENYSEIAYEFETGDPDVDTVIEYIDESEDVYEKTGIIKRGKTWVIPVKWIISPYIENLVGATQFLNNSGENVVVLSNCIINNFHWLRGGIIYIVNYRGINGDLSDMFAHVMCNESLPVKFWDRYIGGIRLKNPGSYRSMCKTDIIRESGVVVQTGEMGKTFDQMLLEHFENSKNESNEIKVIEEASTSTIQIGTIEVETDINPEEKEMLERAERFKQVESVVKELVDDCEASGIFTKEKSKQVLAKYKNAARSKIGLSGNELMASLFTEVELNNMNKEFYSNEVSEVLTDRESIMMMQAPESLGAAYSHSKPDTKAFNNLQLKCEMEAIHPEMAMRIASGTLRISSKMLKVMKSHYNAWRIAVENTRKNRECKQFFLNLFLSSINDSAEVKRTSQDKMWQEAINNLATIVGEEDEASEGSSLYYRVSPTKNLRLKYKIVGT
jgi:hypothetical protein